MVKKIIVNSFMLGAVLALTGCSYAGGVYAPITKKTVGIDSEVVTLSCHTPGAPNISRASDATKTAWFALQRAAMYTQEKGDKYFAVHKPKLISNTDGSTMNTPEEFAEKCTTSGAGSIGSAFDAFGVGEYGCRIASYPVVKTGFIEIVTFKEKPKNILAYDADEVMAYMKAHDLLINSDDYVVKGEFSDKNDRFMNNSYKNWYSEKRDK